MSHWLLPPPALRRTATSTTMTDADDTLLVTGSGAVVTLPSAQGRGGRRYVLKNVASENTTVVAPAGQSIDGAAKALIAGPYASITLLSDGATWLSC